jgi:hypothetical protein
MQSFLGLVHYISAFLPKLAKHTLVLTPRTTKEAKKDFLLWTPVHQEAFEVIKQPVMSQECLTVIG